MAKRSQRHLKRAGFFKISRLQRHQDITTGQIYFIFGNAYHPPSILSPERNPRALRSFHLPIKVCRAKGNYVPMPRRLWLFGNVGQVVGKAYYFQLPLPKRSCCLNTGVPNVLEQVRRRLVQALASGCAPCLVPCRNVSIEHFGGKAQLDLQNKV